MKILVGSKNPVKIDAAKEAFSSYFKNIEVEGVDVMSSVPDQPIDEETFEGAEHRAKVLKKLDDKAKIGASFFVGIEGGIINIYSKWFGIGAVCIMDDKSNTGFAATPMFELWTEAIDKVLEGVELGDIMGEITGDCRRQKKRRCRWISNKWNRSKKGSLRFCPQTCNYTFLERGSLFEKNIA